MPTTLILALCHLLVTGLPLIAALWGMVLVAYHQEWVHHRQLVRETRLAPAARGWLWKGEGWRPSARILCVMN
jgi:hypothetical protein